MGLEAIVIRQQMDSLVMQRDEAAHKYQQCVGAISILQEQMRFLVEQEMAEQEAARVAASQAAVMDCMEGAQLDGQVEQQEPEQVA